MTDADYKKQKGRVVKMTYKWVQLLGLRHWDILHEFPRDGGRPTTDDGTQTRTVFATTIASWPYQRAVIEWNLRHIVSMDNDDLEQLVVHELMHIMLSEMVPDGQTQEQANHEERVATSIARAFRWVRASKR